MKKIKFFALAIMAMLSTNAFAAVDPLSTMTYRYSLNGDNEATILGYTTDYPAEQMATTVIPATLVNGDEEYPVVAIAADAFAGNENITAIDFSAAENLEEIEANAFVGTPIQSLDLSNTKLEVLYQLFETLGAPVAEIKLPETLTVISENAFNGLAKLETLVIPGGEDADGNPLPIEINAGAFTKTMKLTTLTLPGTVVIKEGAFTTSYISTLTIDGDLAAEAVKEGAFVRNNTQTITLNYTPSEVPEAVEFDRQAFASTDVASKYVTFNTTDDEYLELLAGLWGNTGSYGVNLTYTPPVDPEEVLAFPVYNNGGTYAYAGFVVPEGGIKIAKKQGENNDINVMVYGAYFDNLGTAGESAILMDQLHLINGYYYLPFKDGSENAFVVKSSSEEDVVYEELSEEDLVEDQMPDSRNYDQFMVEQNKIQVYNGADCYAIDIIEAYAGRTVYFLRDLEGGKPFGWKQRNDESVISEGQLFLLYPEEAVHEVGPIEPARVIWLDGSEDDATAIKTVKKANADKNVIYNVAGQKVSAAYKGLVIKDGKKYIQK